VTDDLTPNTESSSPPGSPVLSITAENQGSLKVLIFGDSQTGGRRGTGAKIRDKLVASGLSADNVQVSTNVSMTTEFLIAMATANGGRGDFKGEGSSLNNDARWRTGRSRHPTIWSPSSGSPFPTAEYDIVFMFAGGNDTNAVGKWNSTYLNTGGSVSRLASLFGSKLVWIGPAPSTRITGRTPLARAGGNADIYLTGPTARVDGTPMVAAQRREEYNNRLKRILANTGVLYLDVRDIPSRSLPGAVEQLPGVYFPNLGDGLHIHSGAHGRTTVDRVSSWVVEQAQTTPSANVAAGPGAAASSSTSSTPSRPSSPNITMWHEAPCNVAPGATSTTSARLGTPNNNTPASPPSGIEMVPASRSSWKPDPNGPDVPYAYGDQVPATQRPGIHLFSVDGEVSWSDWFDADRSRGAHRAQDLVATKPLPDPATHTPVHPSPREGRRRERPHAIVWSPLDIAIVTHVQREGQPGSSSSGNSVVLESSRDRIYFSHLHTVTVNEGDFVTLGQQVGTQGNTGNATLQHVHYGWKTRRTPTSRWVYTNQHDRLMETSEPVRDSQGRALARRRRKDPTP